MRGEAVVLAVVRMAKFLREQVVVGLLGHAVRQRFSSTSFGGRSKRSTSDMSEPFHSMPPEGNQAIRTCAKYTLSKGNRALGRIAGTDTAAQTSLFESFSGRPGGLKATIDKRAFGQDRNLIQTAGHFDYARDAASGQHPLALAQSRTHRCPGPVLTRPAKHSRIGPLPLYETQDRLLFRPVLNMSRGPPPAGLVAHFDAC
ncbi:hypothetical protein K458DRAFT_46344 [Lentithecium fluviatile CBS 122367]|uniref:Uncharacterized protein n=1 Tax=Lentithecium fluviatile CBS 122367 TaxID=1168545 RepID=A0A6G1IYU5_9PLEO|nr:hypothetical protein K458DRAFT_46344 [Lentithecium fluviatile CBS 122367]